MDEVPPPPSTESNLFRLAIGFISLAGGLFGFVALYFIEIPARNENALMFALGIVFGWGSSVVNSEFGASSTGRKMAEQAVRKLESAP